MGLKGVQVVIHFLPRQAHARGQRRRRRRFGQLRQETTPDRVKRHGGGVWIFDDFKGKHALILALTIFLVNKLLEIARLPLDFL
jgi:hypothetical protein